MNKYEDILKLIGFKKLDTPPTYFFDIYVFGSIEIEHHIGNIGNRGNNYLFKYTASFTIKILKEPYLQTGIIFEGNMKVSYLDDRYADDKRIDIIRNHHTSKMHGYIKEEDVIKYSLEYKELKVLYRKNKIKKLL